MTHTPNTDTDAAFAWEYTEVAGGGQRWNLRRNRTGRIEVTVIRLPGTLTRCYWNSREAMCFTTRDYVGLMDAFRVIGKSLRNVPTPPMFSDAELAGTVWEVPAAPATPTDEWRVEWDSAKSGGWTVYRLEGRRVVRHGNYDRKPVADAVAVALNTGTPYAEPVRYMTADEDRAQYGPVENLS